MIHFVGAGPGAPDLITVRGQNLLKEADIVIYAGSLVNEELLKNCKEGCEIYNSAHMTLEEVIGVMVPAEQAGKKVVRLHTGDPSLYGAIREQMDLLDEAGIDYESTPGVSAFCGAAAALNMEYTLPGISQSAIITRMAGRTPVPEKESIESFAAHGTTMVLFLSSGMTEELEGRLIEGGYAPETPAAIVYKATWPDEKCLYCTVGTISETAKAAGIRQTALIIVGPAVAQGGYDRSKLYDPSFETGTRGIRGNQILSVIGIGPGKWDGLTLEAQEALEKSEVIVGYTAYVDLIREKVAGKKLLSTPMTREIERCKMAFEEAMKGYRTALICSGDAGVYGMAGPVCELLPAFPKVETRIIPGVSAAQSGAAILGAPLMHDYCCISLSDRLTPWELITQRLKAAAESDMVICLYNPSSRHRPDYLKRACDVLLQYKLPETVCGIARNIGRADEATEVMTLAELAETSVDMFSTVFIGNKETRIINGKMVTPRGYRDV